MTTKTFSGITSLILDGALVAGTGAAATCFALTAVIWAPVDAALIERADNAGWDASLLLPHQNVLWLSINGGLVLSVLVFLLALLNLVLKITRMRSRTRVAAAPNAEHRDTVPALVGRGNDA